MHGHGVVTVRIRLMSSVHHRRPPTAQHGLALAHVHPWLHPGHAAVHMLLVVHMLGGRGVELSVGWVVALIAALLHRTIHSHACGLKGVCVFVSVCVCM